MSTGELSPIVQSDDLIGENGSVELFDFNLPDDKLVQPAMDQATIHVDAESSSDEHQESVSTEGFIGSEVRPHEDQGDSQEFQHIIADTSHASPKQVGLASRIRGIIEKATANNANRIQKFYEDGQLDQPIDPLLAKQANHEPTTGFSSIQITDERSLAQLGSGTTCFPGHDVLNQALEQAAEDRRRQLELQRLDCHIEISNQVNKLNAKKEVESKTISVFTAYEAGLPLINRMAENIVERSRQIIGNRINLQGINELNFDDEPEAWANPGRAVLEKIFTGQVAGMDNDLVQRVAVTTVNYSIKKFAGTQLKSKDRKALNNPLRALDYLDPEETWHVLSLAVENHARVASVDAHKTFFRHITMRDDFSAEHRDKQSPDEAQPPHIMERDFTNLITALGIEDRSWQQIQDGSYVAGINIPFEPGVDNPLDRIIESSGNNIRSIDTPGYSSFVALVKAQRPGKDEEHWLVLGSHPLITADSSPETITEAPSNKYIIKNKRRTPHTSNGNMIQMPLSVWQLFPRGYVGLVEIIQDYGRPFSDFRPPIRQSRDSLIESVGIKTALLRDLYSAKSNANQHFDRLSGALAVSSSDVDKRLIESTVGNVISELSGAVQTFEPIAEIGKESGQQTVNPEIASILDAEVIQTIEVADSARRVRLSNQDTQPLKAFDQTDQGFNGESISFI